MLFQLTTTNIFFYLFMMFIMGFNCTHQWYVIRLMQVILSGNAFFFVGLLEIKKKNKNSWLYTSVMFSSC